LDPDRILALNGIGPKSFEEIADLTDALRVIPEEIIPVVEEAAAEALVVEETEIDADASEEMDQAAVPEVDQAVEAIQDAEVIEPVEEPVQEIPQETKQQAEAVEEDTFDKLFSYDASKYGYYAPEKPVVEEDEDEESKPGKKKKRKKRRPAPEETDNWDEW